MYQFIWLPENSESVFPQPFQPALYRKHLDLCSLTPDLSVDLICISHILGMLSIFYMLNFICPYFLFCELFVHILCIVFYWFFEVFLRICRTYVAILRKLALCDMWRYFLQFFYCLMVFWPEEYLNFICIAFPIPRLLKNILMFLDRFSGFILCICIFDPFVIFPDVRSKIWIRLYFLLDGYQTSTFVH